MKLETAYTELEVCISRTVKHSNDRLFLTCLFGQRSSVGASNIECHCFIGGVGVDESKAQNREPFLLYITTTISFCFPNFTVLVHFIFNLTYMKYKKMYFIHIYSFKHPGGGIFSISCTCTAAARETTEVFESRI